MLNHCKKKSVQAYDKQTNIGITRKFNIGNRYQPHIIKINIIICAKA